MQIAGRIIPKSNKCNCASSAALGLHQFHVRSTRVWPTDGDRPSGLKRTKNCRLEYASVCVFSPFMSSNETKLFSLFFFFFGCVFSLLFVVSLLLLLFIYFFHFRLENAMCKMHSSVGCRSALTYFSPIFLRARVSTGSTRV